MTTNSTLNKKCQLLKKCLEMDLSYDTIMMVLDPMDGLPREGESRNEMAAILLNKLETCKTEEEVIQKFQNQEA